MSSASRARSCASSATATAAGSPIQSVVHVPSKLQAFDLSLIDSLVVPASLHDVQDRFLHMNAAAERASGTPNAEMLGRHFTAPLPPEEREKVTALFRRAVEHGEPTDFEVVFIDGNGHQRGARAEHLPLRSNDEIVGVLVLAFEGGGPVRATIGLDPQPRSDAPPTRVLDLIAVGASTSEIAKKLTLSTETGPRPRPDVLRELHVHTPARGDRSGRRIGLLAPPVLAAAAARPGGERPGRVDGESEPIHLGLALPVVARHPRSMLRGSARRSLSSRKRGGKS